MAIWENKPNTKAAVQYAALLLVMIAVFAQLALSGLTPVKNIALRATENIAGIIGVAGTVAPNEYNALAAQFDQKDKSLTMREQDLALREQALLSGNDRITLNVLFGITGLLLMLISLNFYFDWKRDTPAEGHVPSHADEFTTRL